MMRVRIQTVMMMHVQTVHDEGAHSDSDDDTCTDSDEAAYTVQTVRNQVRRQ